MEYIISFTPKWNEQTGPPKVWVTDLGDHGLPKAAGIKLSQETKPQVLFQAITEFAEQECIKAASGLQGADNVGPRVNTAVTWTPELYKISFEGDEIDQDSEICVLEHLKEGEIFQAHFRLLQKVSVTYKKSGCSII
jgi:hypothetical protein